MRRAAALAIFFGAIAQTSAAPRTYAIVIAQNRSLDPGVPALRYADDDGARNFELLSLIADRAALFAVLDDETARLHPRTARRAEVPERAAILARLAEWNRAMEADLARGDEPELYFLYAGHGDVDASGMGYVSLHDAKLTRADLFRDVVAPSKARFVHVLVDACKSYFLVNARGGTWKDDRAPESHDRALADFLAAEALERHPRVGVVVATSGAQETHEWSRWRGGILSHELRSALTGAGDVNGDGRVEYSEVRAFVAAANARVQHPEARLNIFARAPQIDRHRPLIDLRRARAARFLHFAPPSGGRFHIEDDRGLRWADLHKEPSSEFDLLLDPERTYTLRRDDTEEAEVRLAGGPTGIKPRKIEIRELNFRSLALASRGALETSFRRDLYQVPFGRGFYDGYVATSGDAPVEGGAPFILEEAPRHRHHALSAGYLLAGAPLGVPGFSHGVDVRYQYRLARWLDAGLAVQAARAPGDAGQSATRVALLAHLGVEWRPVAPVGLRLDVGGGWQYATGVALIPDRGLVQGADPGGGHFEACGGISWDIQPAFALQARGGLSVDVSTLAVPDLNYRDTIARVAPLLHLAFLVRL